MDANGCLWMEFIHDDVNNDVGRCWSMLVFMTSPPLMMSSIGNGIGLISISLMEFFHIFHGIP
jgi:hypothetical protein